MQAKPSFLLEFDWRDSRQHQDACEALGKFGAAVAGSSSSSEHAILIRAGALDWPLTQVVSEDWLTHETKAR